MGHLQQGGISYRIYCTEIGKGILTINKLTTEQMFYIMYMGVSLKVLLHVDVNGGSLFAES